MDYKAYLHHNLTKAVSAQEVLFYHTVKYLIGDRINVKFERDKSLFSTNTQSANSLFTEGFSLIKRIYGKEQSLIETLFNSLSQKYSFHCDIESVSSPKENYLTTELLGRDIYIKGGFYPLKYSQIIKYSHNSSSLEELFNDYWQVNLDFTSIAEVLSSIQEPIRKNITKLFSEDIQQPMIEVLQLLLIFLYPSTFNPIKRFSVYVITSFENQIGEITNGGLSVFYAPNIESTNLFNLRNKIAYITALWANYESTESLIHIIQQKSLHFAITTILVDSFAHNVAAHSLSALEWWFKRRADAIDAAYFKHWKEKIAEMQDLKAFKKEYENWLNEKTIALKNGLEEDDKAHFVAYLKKLKNPNDNTAILPVSVNHVLYPLLRFLRDKAVFWSGVTRDYAFGGEMYSWFDLLYYEFAYNPLFLGTIAFSEGITKLNIWLKVMNAEGKTLRFENGEGALTHQPFVSIDLSESGIQQKDDTHNEYLQSGIAQYRLLRHDEKYFKEWEKLLSEEKYKVFVPNGKVGVHAFLTLIENSLRNVKHYKDEKTLKKMREEGIDIHISLTPTRLNPQAETNEFPLFRVGVRLNHETEFTDKEGKDLDETLFFNALESIVKETGEARLGGNSQDKICASMLLNNQFSKVETVNEPRDIFYYPWIYFCMAEVSKEPEAERQGKFSFTPNWENRKSYLKGNNSIKYIQETIKRDYQAQREKAKLENPQIGKGAIVKYWYMWKGEVVKKAGAVLEDDNLSRFKFLRKSEENKNPRNEIFREVESTSDNPDDLYVEWLSKWVGDFGIEIWDETALNVFNPIVYTKFTKGEKQPTWNFVESPTEDANKVEIRQKHAIQGNIDNTQNIVGIRSHGVWLSMYFKNNSRYNHAPQRLYFYEMVEVLGTKIFISDNRVTERVSGKMLYEKATLNLKVIAESKEMWIAEKENIIQYHLVILHLSFIEAMGYKEGNITQFIEDSFDINGLPPNFRLVITSGRGRSEWMRDIVDNKRYSFVTFKPIESILEAIENGLSIKDDFQVKYNLVKLFLK